LMRRLIRVRVLVDDAESAGTDGWVAMLISTFLYMPGVRRIRAWKPEFVTFFTLRNILPGSYSKLYTCDLAVERSA
jgi:hypothetical protein